MVLVIIVSPNVAFLKMLAGKTFDSKNREIQNSDKSKEASTGRSSLPFFCISMVKMTKAVKSELLTVCHGAYIGENVSLICLLSPYHVVLRISKRCGQGNVKACSILD